MQRMPERRTMKAEDMRLPDTLTLKKRPHMERGWTWWLAPKPFDIVSTALYSLADNGCGFDLTRDLKSGGEDREGHYGLRGLQERLELVGGCLRIESEPGAGTHLLASVPKEIGLRHAK